MDPRGRHHAASLLVGHGQVGPAMWGDSGGARQIGGGGSVSGIGTFFSPCRDGGGSFLARSDALASSRPRPLPPMRGAGPPPYCALDLGLGQQSGPAA